MGPILFCAVCYPSTTAVSAMDDRRFGAYPQKRDVVAREQVHGPGITWTRFETAFEARAWSRRREADSRVLTWSFISVFGLGPVSSVGQTQSAHIDAGHRPM
jgi:hypothetical protein